MISERSAETVIVDTTVMEKARVRYEFGSKVSVTTTHREGFVVGMRAMPGNPYDGHRLREALEQVEILTETPPKRAFVDRGYRGHDVETTAVCIAGQKRGMIPALRRDLRRRSAIEPAITGLHLFMAFDRWGRHAQKRNEEGKGR